MAVLVNKPVIRSGMGNPGLQTGQIRATQGKEIAIPSGIVIDIIVLTVGNSPRTYNEVVVLTPGACILSSIGKNIIPDLIGCRICLLYTSRCV